jgi:hypothetical protein
MFGGAASAALEEQRRGLGSASGLDQRLGAVLAAGSTGRLAGDGEAVELGGVVEGEGLAGRVGGGGGVLDGLVDAAAGVQVPGDAFAVVAVFGEQGLGRGRRGCAAGARGSRTLQGGLLDRLVERRDRQGGWPSTARGPGRAAG